MPKPFGGGGMRAYTSWVNALGAAGLPFLRFKAQPGYRVAELKQYIHAKIQQAEHIKAAIPGDQQRPATGENHGKHGHESPIAA